MKIVLKMTLAFVAVLVFAPANAALVNYTITGTVDTGGGGGFGLNDGDTVTATGVFDDTPILGGSGSISFESPSSGNTMSIDLNGTIITAANDDRYSGGTGTGPNLIFSSYTAGSSAVLSNFDFSDYSGSTTHTDFSSLFLAFTGFDLGFNYLQGTWGSTVAITAVPVPAAVWLFGSGLLGLVGIARKKKV